VTPAAHPVKVRGRRQRITATSAAALAGVTR
jgi:hypothetical protein